MDTNVLAEQLQNADGTNVQIPASEKNDPIKTTDLQTGNPADKKDSSTSPEVPKGVIREIVSLREKNRERQKTIEELNIKISELESKNKTNPENISLLDDPDAFLKQRDTKLIEEAENRVIKRINKEAQDKEFHNQLTDSAKFLLSQEDIAKDPEGINQIKEILNDPELTSITMVSPKIAAELALERWRKAKGINVNANDNASRSSSSASASLSGGTGNKRIYSRSEFVAESKKLDYKDPEFNKKWQFLLDAQKEGRIR